MRTISKISLFGALLLFAFASSQNVFAVSKTVGLCAGPGLHYNTISAAVLSIASVYPATIDVCPGTYTEQVTINVPAGKTVTLTGIKGGGGDQSIVAPPSGGMTPSGLRNDGQPFSAQLYVHGGGTVNVNNLVFDATGHLLDGCGGTFLFGVMYQNSSGSMNHITTRFQNFPDGTDGCQFGDGVYAESNGGTGTPETVSIASSSIHDYDKNGIVAKGIGLTFNATSNVVMGYGPIGNLAQNGIELASGASGSIKLNTVTGDRYTGADYSASGILLFNSGNGVQVVSNQISQTDGGIADVSDGSLVGGEAGNNSFTSNRISQTTFDGIDACSQGNTIMSNTILQSGNSGVHIDTDDFPGFYTCNSGTGNVVQKNTITEACAGVLSGTDGALVGLNTYWDTGTFTLAGDSCPAIEANVLAKGTKATARHRTGPFQP